MLLKLLSTSSTDFRHVVVGLKDGDTIGPRISRLGVPVHCLKLRDAARGLVGVFSLGSLIRQYHPQVIQGWLPHGNLAATLAELFSLTRIPVVWNVRHSLDDFSEFRRMTVFSIRMGSLISGRASAIVYNSLRGAKQHQAIGYRASRQVVIPNGFDCDLFHPNENSYTQIRAELGVEARSVLVGLVARYDALKDHRTFLRAAALLAREHRDVHFVLAGRGMVPEQLDLMEIIAQEGLQNRVFLLGDRPDIERITAALDIACSASWSEGFPNAIGEAMACGVPCVVTDVGDTAYLIGKSGISVPPRNPSALADGIGQLVGAGAVQRRELGAAARERIKAEFSQSQITRKYEQLYRGLTCGPSRSNHY